MVEPRFQVAPKPKRSLGRKAAKLCEQAGLVLDDWQRRILTAGLGFDERGMFSAGRVGMVMPRQNGKSAVLEARILAGAVLLEERMIIYSAHNFDTAMEVFYRLEGMVMDTPELARLVKGKPLHSHGSEGFNFVNGSRVRFRTRTKGGARGFSCDCLILDEAMILPEFSHSAMLPTQSATNNPQVWYAGSSVDQEVHEHGVVLARVREQGMAGDADRLAYFEWSLPYDKPEDVPDEVVEDLGQVALANPAFGTRINPEQVKLELYGMDRRGFAVERCGVGDWPATDGFELLPITYSEWVSLRDSHSVLQDPVCLAFDVSPDRSSSIAAAGRRADGLFHDEILDHRQGTKWLPGRLAELCEDNDVESVVCDGYGPAGSLVPAIEEAGVPVRTLTAKEHTQACGLLVDAVKEKQLRHLGSGELATAVRGARTRPLGDAWAWSRKASSIDISPLVAATLALAQASALPDDTSPIEVY